MRFAHSIVIIHGLQGHPYKTWACTKPPSVPILPPPADPKLSIASESSQRNIFRNAVLRLKRPASEKAKSRGERKVDIDQHVDTKSDAPSAVFWPGDLLPEACPNSRILVYGYDTKITKFMTGAANKNSVLSHSKDLLFALGRTRDVDRPLILVAHSLGGIVVKEVSLLFHV
jgi:hypothetical protein